VTKWRKKRKAKEKASSVLNIVQLDKALKKEEEDLKWKTILEITKKEVREWIREGKRADWWKT
jgi:hypothetical protein